MSETFEYLIKMFAAQPREKARDGKLYGQSIDLFDPDQCLIAGYYVGRRDQYEEAQDIKNHDHMLGLA